MFVFKKMLRSALKKRGYVVVKHGQFTPDMEGEFRKIYEKCKPFTMTSTERMHALYRAVRYVVEAGVPGDLVECGVWRGGSAMMMAATLMELGETGKTIYLYDTYAGMTEPSGEDVRVAGGSSEDVRRKWKKSKNENRSEWSYASVEEVKRNLAKTGYPSDKLVYIKGDVLKTIPDQAPGKIALLRLDTDWYESTYHEMKHLYPLLVSRGVLLLDDYGWWRGSRKAVDQYFAEERVKSLLLNRIDRAGYIGLKHESR